MRDMTACISTSGRGRSPSACPALRPGPEARAAGRPQVGVSGAGKTTLMDVLAGRKTSAGPARRGACELRAARAGASGCKGVGGVVPAYGTAWGCSCVRAQALHSEPQRANTFCWSMPCSQCALPQAAAPIQFPCAPRRGTGKRRRRAARALAAGRIAGDIRVNGFPWERRAFARVSGYVEQSDVNAPRATVWEALAFSAALRLPPSVGAAARADFVETARTLCSCSCCACTATGGMHLSRARLPCARPPRLPHVRACARSPEAAAARARRG